jgi:hypothetical protein
MAKEKVAGDKDKVISVRMSIEAYERLKEYASSHGEEMSETARRAIERHISGREVSSEPASPGPGATIPPELLAMPEAMKKLEEQMGEIRGCLGGLAEKLEGWMGKLGTPPVPHLPGVVAGIGIAGALLQKVGEQQKDTQALLNQAKAQAEALAKKTGRRGPKAGEWR